MKENVAINVHNLHKSFISAESKHGSVKQHLLNIGKSNKKHYQKVLDGVDFEIYKGEFFGIVGKNGSGKSTLLKLLAGVYTPDSGAVEVNGNLTPFIELGVGFNPELSGRDNVYLSASLLGYTRKQVGAMYGDIVAFAELEEHMDKKLKNYSSGMQVRLAFSIAVKAKNDILIFDEVLAVGDEAFQQKCMKIFEEYRDNKQTVILVTHSMENVRRFCSRALILNEGKIKHIGNVDRVSREYLKINHGSVEINSNEDQQINHSLIVKVADNKKIYKIEDSIKLKVEWPKELEVSRVGIAINGSANQYVFGSNTGLLKLNTNSIEHMVKFKLGIGSYLIAVAIYDKSGKVICLESRAWDFEVEGKYDDTVGGLTIFPYEYKQK